MLSDSEEGRESKIPEPEIADPWVNHLPASDYGGVAYGEFLDAFRDLQDAASEANPPEETWASIAALCRSATRDLSEWAAPEKHQPAGTRMDLPGRGHPLLLPFVTDEDTDHLVRGRVVFRRFHLGGHGAAHGGTLPLLFDEVLGRLSNAGDRPIARTAYLTVNYRYITPIGKELHLDATFDRQQGRKRWVSGRLTDGETLIADAEGLFVELRPGQP
jgi:acyl-coenzyme A thioesterase PaaI-like protein